MTIRIIKPQYALEPAGKPVEAPGWKNIIFLKSGKTFYGCNVHPSEQAARAVMKNWEEHMRRLYFQRPMGDYAIIDEQGNRLYMYSQYSHAIQIPWSEA